MGVGSVRFLFPWAWAWSAAVVVVVLLALLRRQEREYPVSALFLWERIPPDPARRLERLRRWWDPLVLLQTSIVVLIAWALAQPVVWARKPAGALAIVLDGSASMAASGRPEEALSLARNLLSNSAGPWTVVLWADPPRVLVPPTSDRAEVEAGLRAFAPTLGGRPPLGQALALLPGAWDQIAVITDDPPEAVGVQVYALEPKDNLALVALAVRADPDGTGYSALVRVRNATSRFQDVQVLLHTGVGTLVQSRLVEPQEEETLVFRLGGLSSTLRAELLPRDAFPWDNVRYWALAGGALRVRWLGSEDRYVLAALQASLPAEVVRSAPWDLTVAVRANLSAAPPGPVLMVEASSPEAPLAESVPVSALRGEASPLLRHVGVENFRAAQVRPAALPAQAQVVLWADEHPAVAVWESPQGRRALIALDLVRSNLPLLVDFPVLVRNLLAWLMPWEAAPAFSVGQAVTLPEGVEVISPAGPRTGIWVPDRPGFYEVNRAGRKETWAVNVPAEESLVTGAQPAVGEGTAQAAWTLRGLGPWIALAALALLVVEWGWALRRGGG